MRVVDARRALLYSSTRRLQTAHALMQARKQLDESRRALEKLEDQRRLTIHESLQSAELKLAEEHARLRSIQAQLDLAGSRSPQVGECITSIHHDSKNCDEPSDIRSELR